MIDGDPHPPETSHLRGHVIVVGLHGIGLRVVEQLPASASRLW